MLKQERLAGKISSYYMYSTVVYVLVWKHVYLSLWMCYITLSPKQMNSINEDYWQSHLPGLKSIVCTQNHSLLTANVEFQQCDDGVSLQNGIILL